MIFPAAGVIWRDLYGELNDFQEGGEYDDITMVLLKRSE